MNDLISPQLVDGFALALLDGGYALHERILPLGRALYGALLLLTMSWFGVNTLLEMFDGEHLGSVVTRLLRFVLLAGVVGWLLEGYELVFRDAFVRGGDAVAAAIGGQGTENQGFSTAWNVFTDLILGIWTSTRTQLQQSVGTSYSPTGIVSAVGAWVFMAMFMMVAIILLALAMIVFAVIHVMGYALVGIALALGPFFIPWLLWETTNALFFGWARFLFLACLYKVVGVTVLAMARPIFEKLVALLAVQNDANALPGATSNPLAPARTLMLGLAFVILASILGYLMKQVPQIASALMSGSRVDTGFARGAGRSVQGAVRQIQRTVRGGGRRASSGRAAHHDSDDDD